MPLFVRILASSLLGVVVYAQRPVLTVGGFNPQHADLPAAVAAAQPGSILECRPGVYTGFSTDKALRIVGKNVTIQPPTGADFAIELRDLSGTDEFVLRGVGLDLVPGAMGGMSVRNVTAPVIVEGVNVFSLFGHPGLDVFNTGTVHVSRSILVGNPGMRVSLANFVSSENVIGSATGVGAVVNNALFESVRTIFAGTDQPALRISDSDARLSSDGSSSLIVLGAPPGPVSALRLIDSYLQYDPSRFLMIPANGAPIVHETSSTILLEEVPCMTAGPSTLGQVAMARVTNGTPVAGVIAVSNLRPTPIVIASTAIHIDLPPAIVAVGGVVDPVGLVFGFDVPNDPNVRGLLFAFQAVTLPVGEPQISSPALWYIE